MVQNKHKNWWHERVALIINWELSKKYGNEVKTKWQNINPFPLRGNGKITPVRLLWNISILKRFINVILWHDYFHLALDILETDKIPILKKKRKQTYHLLIVIRDQNIFAGRVEESRFYLLLNFAKAGCWAHDW